ncbi:MAG: WD40 repeat domain-containing protein [Promethearchaeota archaeon]|jgi:WD40 repeat protein
MKKESLFCFVFIWIALAGDIISLSNQCIFNHNNAEYSTLKSAASKTPLRSFKLTSIRDIDISSDGDYIAAVGIEERGGIVYLFNTSLSIPVWSYLVAEPNAAMSVAISADGAYVAVGTAEGTLFVFNITSGQPLWNYTTSGTIRTVAISSNGSYIIAGNSAKMIYLFNYESSIPLWSYNVIRHIRKVTISSDGNTIVIEDIQESVYVFGKNSNIPLWIRRPSYFEWVSSSDISISSDGNYIVLGSGLGENSTYLFNRSSSIPMWEYNVNCSILSIKISSDGNYIKAGTSDGKIYFFNKESNNPIWNYNTGTSITSVTLNSNGNTSAALIYEKGVYLFNKSTSFPIWKYSFQEHTSHPECKVVMSADGEIIAANSHEKVYIFSRGLINDKDIEKNFVLPIFISLIALAFFSLIATTTIVVLRHRKALNDN